jgi:hypothetical protein
MNTLLILFASAVFGFVIGLLFTKPDPALKNKPKKKKKQRNYRTKVNDDYSYLYYYFM